MYYFAYGSNMLTARLARRVPSVTPVGPAWLPGHGLRFHMQGADGSGKCNVLRTGVAMDVVHGVLYELDENRLQRLHAAEGPGYEFLQLDVATARSDVTAAIYRSRPAWLDNALTPFDWYLGFVVRGAQEHGLPDDYIRALERILTRPDPNKWRTLRNRRILRRKARNVVARMQP